eukprot:SAG31_NODE_27825_length_419_cov_1.171875_1_plen_24_part_10
MKPDLFYRLFIDEDLEKLEKRKKI